jgi:hypothetical protein
MLVREIGICDNGLVRAKSAGKLTGKAVGK